MMMKIFNQQLTNLIVQIFNNNNNNRVVVQQHEASIFIFSEHNLSIDYNCCYLIQQQQNEMK